MRFFYNVVMLLVAGAVALTPGITRSNDVPLSPSATPTPAVTTAPPVVTTSPPTVTIDAVGDVMLGWGVNALVQTVDPNAPFARVRDVLSHADAVVGNLECSLSNRGVPTKAKSPKDLKARREFLLRGSPDAALGLAQAGFAAMTLANNHTFDYGANALDDTLAALRDNGIATAGAGDNAAEAWAPAFFERRGMRFALIGLSSIIPRGYAAGKRTPGIAPGRDMSTGDVTAEYLRELGHAIRIARRQADVVIIYEHWGKELVSTPSADEERLAHAAIDDGATLVLGAHPHVLGPVERYGRGLIAFSLGNFVFDTQPGVQTHSAILEITLRDGSVAEWRAVPVRLQGGVPEPTAGAVATEVSRVLAGEEAIAPPPPPPVGPAAPPRGARAAVQHGPPSRT
jgi:poly-gamma-glutamate capsule biosynthesis protein CapA/YwtB (metallophosphatase superfamily)